jgi:hypothetical protein
MSNLVDIKELSKDAIISELTKEVKRLSDRLAKHEVVPVIKMHLTPEELICIEQINILKSKSSDRELSLDECKRLDLLIKNLRLIRNESIETIDATNHSSIDEAALVAIATNRFQSSE